MTRKHFKALAEALRETNASVETIERVAQACADSNPRFHFRKFIEAATPERKPEPEQFHCDGCSSHNAAVHAESPCRWSRGLS